jgi:hypothetical protein
MGMSLGIKSMTYSPSEDQSWLASAHGTQEMDSITMDGVLTAAVFPSGLVPSGIPVGRVTATGRYAPSQSAATDGSQVVAGHLFTTLDLTAGLAATGWGQPATSNMPASLYWHGEVILAKLPAQTGRVDLTVLANQPKSIRYV